MSLSELIGFARWDAYRDRMHCAQRRKAFERDAAKAVKRWIWSARSMREGAAMVCLRKDSGASFCGSDAGCMPGAIERLTLEALRDVARATKDRLDR